MKNTLLTASSKHPYLAQNVRPLDISRRRWGGSPAYPQATKVQIEQRALPRGEF
jgi:hypothetical protein